ncbi:PD-(D/E)XK motif protein [Streptomyces cacaoi]|uniref:PD-(D/E)XK motif protein n=1 Tax=Streptomyces cacaoi TaxID=1898 RepID=UPI00332560B3
MSGTMRDEVRRRWSDLAGRPASSARHLRTTPLPVNTRIGPPLAALDHEGHRHLLVPIASDQRVRGGVDGPVLTLRKRPLEGPDTYQNYADLACLRSDLDDVFTGLCGDVLEEIERRETKALATSSGGVKALHRVLDRWRALLRTGGPPLGPARLAALHGELSVLLRLLRLDPGAHRLWVGPSGHRHDFTSGSEAVEVKTSTGNDSLRIRVHGLRQLEAPAGGNLRLACFRLERSHGPRGTSVVDLVERAMALCDDEGALLRLLAEAGYHPADAERYRSVVFAVTEERWYLVDAGFPKLTSAGLAAADVPVTVSDVEYSVDLAVEPPRALPPTRVERHLEALLEGDA